MLLSLDTPFVIDSINGIYSEGEGVFASLENNIEYTEGNSIVTSVIDRFSLSCSMYLQ